MEERLFGKIGVKFPILSFGAQRVVDGHGCSETQAVKIMNRALDRGIRYFDTAWHPGVEYGNKMVHPDCG